MRKLFVVAIALACCLAFTGPAFAADQSCPAKEY